MHQFSYGTSVISYDKLTKAAYVLYEDSCLLDIFDSLLSAISLGFNPVSGELLSYMSESKTYQCHIVLWLRPLTSLLFCPQDNEHT